MSLKATTPNWSTGDDWSAALSSAPSEAEGRHSLTVCPNTLNGGEGRPRRHIDAGLVDALGSTSILNAVTEPQRVVSHMPEGGAE